MACASNARCSSAGAATIGCTSNTWFACVMLVPLAESSRERSRTGSSGASKRCSTDARSNAPPARTAAGIPEFVRAAWILNMRSCHCAKTTAFSPRHRMASRRVTSAEIFDPNAPPHSKAPSLEMLRSTEDASAVELVALVALAASPAAAELVVLRSELKQLRDLTTALHWGHSAFPIRRLRSMHALQKMCAQGVTHGSRKRCKQIPHSSSG